MGIPLRIIAPVLLALGCAGALVAFLWIQLTQSTDILRNAALQGSVQDLAPVTQDITDTSINPQDRALFHLRQGDLMALKGQWAQAEQEYSAATEHGGGLVALRKLAQMQLQRRDIAGVRSTIRKLKRAGARSEDLLLLESIIALRSGELLEAQNLLLAAEESPQKNYGLALLAIVQGDHIAAQEKLDIVINGWEPVLRAHARTLQSAYQEFTLFPEGQNAHLVTLLSRALAQVQECELVLPLLVQVTQLHPDYRDAWIVQGYCELTTVRPEAALASLEQAYNLDPQKSEIQYFLAQSYAALGNHRNAITFYEYALQNGFVPQIEVRQHIADEALKEGNIDLALAQYQLLAADSEATIDTYEGLVATLLTAGKNDDAYSTAKKAANRWPEDANAHELLGWAAMTVDKPEEAKVALKRALKINPYLQAAKERLAELETAEQ